ncbi:hypothetical protein [Roseimicrobium sp. ORNL1]|uniref:hypothetical protein n=1 Tax=Roseimicrobium sp. ORNL1 TaxID=2711231 RepID=UPI0013E12D83|nr:hypothetical protein [Roseimicrobium sp. ORNL1]QIF00199.1 hypothetical protein G5S37_01225 [Roseimicrobium sp. ORNL1]
MKTAFHPGSAVAEILPQLPLDHAQRESVKQAVLALPTAEAQEHLERLSEALGVLAEAVTDMDKMLASMEVTSDQSVPSAYHASMQSA